MYLLFAADTELMFVSVVDIRDEKTVIGSMNLTVQCLAALDAVEREMNVEGTY